MPLSDSLSWVCSRPHFCPTRWYLAAIGFQITDISPATKGTGKRIASVSCQESKSPEISPPTKVSVPESR